MKKGEARPSEPPSGTVKALKAPFAPSRPGTGRRSHRRYSVDLAMQCKLLGAGRIITGKVRDMSCAGILFASSEVLPKTAKVELLIDWPVLLNGTCRLQLRGYGRIVRSNPHGTAVSISRFQFYTAGRSTTASPGLAFGA